MAKRIAKFHKVSFEQFRDGYLDAVGAGSEEEIRRVYDEIRLPKRATAGSAGYDFYAPVSIRLKPGGTIKIPAGIRVKMDEGWVLKCYPRSGLGFKYRLQLNNTVGIIDSDYYKSDNEGHIFVKLTNDSNEGKTLELKAGTGFMQGIFVEYGITIDDDVQIKRNGGLAVRQRNYKNKCAECSVKEQEYKSVLHSVPHIFYISGYSICEKMIIVHIFLNSVADGCFYRILYVAVCGMNNSRLQ